MLTKTMVSGYALNEQNQNLKKRQKKKTQKTRTHHQQHTH